MKISSEIKNHRANKPISPKKKKRWANNMRKYPTKHEKILWEKIKHIKGFCTQKIICGFIADFAHTSSKLIIEVDGKSHIGKEAIEKDKIRTGILFKKGWIVIRFTNEQVEFEIEKVMELIHKVCDQLGVSYKKTGRRAAE